MPIRIRAQRHETSVVEPKDPHLAVSSGELFYFTMSESQFQSCQGNLFKRCDQRLTVKETTTHMTCSMAIYLNNHSQIDERCEFTLLLNDNEFYRWTPTPTCCQRSIWFGCNHVRMEDPCIFNVACCVLLSCHARVRSKRMMNVVGARPENCRWGEVSWLPPPPSSPSLWPPLIDCATGEHFNNRTLAVGSAWILHCALLCDK